jgi:hypothetical protein
MFNLFRSLLVLFVGITCGSWIKPSWGLTSWLAQCGIACQAPVALNEFYGNEAEDLFQRNAHSMRAKNPAHPHLDGVACVPQWRNIAPEWNLIPCYMMLYAQRSVVVYLR